MRFIKRSDIKCFDMRCKLLFILFFSSLYIMGFSQEKRYFDTKIEYEVTFIPDSAQKENVMREQAELLYSDSLSVFRSVRKGKNDSISYSIENVRKRVSEEGGEMEYPSFFKTHFPYTLFFDSAHIHHIEQLEDFNKYIYIENLNQMDWDIKEETESIGEFQCQKAELNYGGRSWEAWFTTEVPIFLGPYKFSGLPGLIVSIEDSTNSWKFELTKIEEGEIPVFFVDSLLDKELKKVNKDDFFKKKRYLLDNIFEINLAAGKVRYPNEKAKKRARDSAKEKALKDNNWIEIYP